VGDPTADASGYSATVTWGDGTSSAEVVSGSAGAFTVIASHDYAIDSVSQFSASYQVTGVLSHPGAMDVSASDVVKVVRPQGAEQAQNLLSDEAGVVAYQTLALFEAPTVTDPAAEFTATVDWGDGSAPDTSPVVEKDSAGLFRVVGGHAYSEEGTFPVIVTVSQHWDAVLPLLQASSSAVVSQQAKLIAPKMETKTADAYLGLSGAYAVPMKFSLDKAVSKKGGWLLMRFSPKIEFQKTRMVLNKKTNKVEEKVETVTDVKEYWRAIRIEPGKTVPKEEFTIPQDKLRTLGLNGAKKAGTPLTAKTTGQIFLYDKFQGETSSATVKDYYAFMTVYYVDDLTVADLKGKNYNWTVEEYNETLQQFVKVKKTGAFDEVKQGNRVVEPGLKASGATGDGILKALSSTSADSGRSSSGSKGVEQQGAEGP
jgi:hypothetical protein